MKQARPERLVPCVGTWRVSHGGTHGTFSWQDRCKQCKHSLSRHTCQAKAVAGKIAGFYSGQPKDPDCPNAGQIEAQPCYKSECHLSDIIPHGLKSPVKSHFQNLEFR